ncbi:unnamed protein product [Protopolystoma xenopodis]|uniref:Calreticulin n=1 Tax=Protopolystoma xenopodis TaxID=117903 RepID=A0A3S5BSD4_9PLAT|nr:unnamed protein product [Protopolystoma xenopodis]
MSAGNSPVDPKEDMGVKTSQDAKFYGLSRKFEKPFSNLGKTIVIQFTVKHEQNIDCGGGYIKLLGSDFDQTQFHGETPYKIMFGPDICGLSTKKVHVIFNYAGKNNLIKHEIRCKDDELTHLYTLIVRPDNTYEVLIDNVSERKGNLEDDWDMLPPKMIEDESVKKPDDWVNEPDMDDPEDKKPEDWDKPKTIPDPKAKKPDDWDDEMDGEWEPPQIDNPDFKGEWMPKKIPNPKYSGPWVQPKKTNPNYKPDPLLYKYDDIAAVGFDLWQVKSGTIFDNVLITDDVEIAKQEGEMLWRSRLKGEEEIKRLKEEEDSKKHAEDKIKEEEEKDIEGKISEKTEDKEPEKHDEL